MVPSSAEVRVAFVGKGGAGKSSIAGTFARVLAARRRRVLALDSDPMPGLAYALGVAAVDAGIPGEVLEEYLDGGRRRFRLRAGLSGPDVIDRYAVPGPDGVRFLQLDKARGARWDAPRATAAFQQVVDDVPTSGWDVVGDLPAGTRQAFQGWGRYADTFLVVAEATPSSLVSARRLARLARMAAAPRVGVVANKVVTVGDADDIAARTGLPLLGSVPLDPALAAAARTGTALVDHDPDAAAVRAVTSLVADLLDQRRPA